MKEKVPILLAWGFLLLSFLFLIYVRSRVVSEQYSLSQELRQYETLKRKNLKLKGRRDELLKPERLRELATRNNFHPPMEKEILR